MIGNLDPTEKKVTVIGAGISGLLIAHALKKNGFEVQVLEATHRAGGLIRTERTESGIAERAAHSILVTPEVKAFFEELGVPLMAVRKKSRARFIYRDGKMRRMPLRFSEIFRTLICFFSRPKLIFRPESGSLQEWGECYLGHSATRFLLSPFISGIFATAPERLFAKLAFPGLVPKSNQVSLFHHFRVRPKAKRAAMMAPNEGMESLVTALCSSLKQELKLNSPITELPQTGNVILTVPSSALSKLIKKDDLFSSEKLLQVQYAPLISMTCFFESSAFKAPPKGVGVLVPRGEGLRLLGCLFNSSQFPNRANNQQHSLTIMYGGTEDQGVLALTDEEITRLMNHEIGILLKSTEDACSVLISRYERAIPLYSHELHEAHEALRKGFCSRPGKLIFSNFSKEVSIRGLINTTLQL